MHSLPLLLRFGLVRWCTRQVKVKTRDFTVQSYRVTKLPAPLHNTLLNHIILIPDQPVQSVSLVLSDTVIPSIMLLNHCSARDQTHDLQQVKQLAHRRFSGGAGNATQPCLRTCGLSYFIRMHCLKYCTNFSPVFHIVQVCCCW